MLRPPVKTAARIPSGLQRTAALRPGWLWTAFLLAALQVPNVQAQPPRVVRDTLHSSALDKPMRLNVYLPAGYTERIRYPVLYLFHGWGGNQDSWSETTRVDSVAADLIARGRIRPTILVTPQLDNSNGLNSSPTALRLGEDPVFSPYKGMYEDYIRHDLVPYIDDRFSTVDAAWGRAVGGDSMGGFAALHVAFRNPGLFGRVGGFQPAMWPDDMPDEVRAFLYPDAAARQARDPIELARDRDLSGMEVYLDCGEQDEVRGGTQDLHRILAKKGVPAQFHLTAGGHTAERLAAHTETYLVFLAGQ